MDNKRKNVVSMPVQVQSTKDGQVRRRANSVIVILTFCECKGLIASSLTSLNSTAVLKDMLKNTTNDLKC